METLVCAGWVLAGSGDMSVCRLGADQQWKHGCVLGGCWPTMETWVRAGFALINNGDMGVCWVGVGQQWRHERLLGGC